MLAAAADCVRGFTVARAKVLKYRDSLDDGPAHGIDGRAKVMDMTGTEDILLYQSLCTAVAWSGTGWRVCEKCIVQGLGPVHSARTGNVAHRPVPKCRRVFPREISPRQDHRRVHRNIQQSLSIYFRGGL